MGQPATAVRAPLRQCPPTRGAALLGLGAAQPEQAVPATDLGAPFGRTAQWIRARTGIRAVRRTGDPAELDRLAGTAAAAALAQAGLDGSLLDLVIVASCSVDAARAELIARRVAPAAASFTVNVACSGFCYAVSTADAMVRDGSARYVLVVAVEQMSSLLDPADLGTSIVFGDGAGAAVLGPADRDGDGDGGGAAIGPVVWGSAGSLAGMIACGADGLLQMAGQSVFRWAVETVPEIAAAACERAGVAVADIDVFVPHQANLRIIEAVTQRIGLQHAVVADDVTRSGNTSAASVPIALTRLLEDGRARSGQLALLLGFGAGLSYAGQVVRLP